MATLIGDKSNEYPTELPATSFYPALKLSEFQNLFGFLEDTTEFELTHTMKVQRALIHKELKPLTDLHSNLVACSQELFNDDSTAELFYQQAVFNLTAAVLIGNRLATDATKEAADRQEALNTRNDVVRAQYRQAIDQLLSNPGVTVELI